MYLSATAYPIHASPKELVWTETLTIGAFNCVVIVKDLTKVPEGKTFVKKLIQQLNKHPFTNGNDFKLTVKFFSRLSPHVHFVASFLHENTLFFIAENAAAWIVRGPHVVPVLTSSGVASGSVKSGDKILLRCGENNEVLLENIREALQQEQLPAAAHALSTVLSGETNGYAVILVGIHAAASGITFKTIAPQTSRSLKLKASMHRIRSELPKARHLFAAVVGIVLLSGGIVIWNKQHREHTQTVLGLTQSLQSVDQLFSEGMALIEVNPVHARELLNQAKQALAVESDKSWGGSEQEKIKSLTAKIDAGITASLRQYDVSLQPFFELDLIKTGAEAIRFALYQDVLILLDVRNRSLYRLSIGNKAAKLIAADPLLAQAKAPLVYGEEVYILADGVFRLNGQAFEAVIPKGETWKNVTDAALFDGNTYLLDIGKNQIWKYLQTDGGFSQTPNQDYLLYDTLVNLQAAQSLAIDGSVWLTTPQGILRFTQGKQDRWEIQGLDQPFSSDLRVFTDETTTQLYILDQGNKRVVVVSKDGVYLSQYRWTESIEINDMVVSEVLKKILLLSRGTIYGIDLK